MGPGVVGLSANRVLVTGATGFVGRALAPYLARHGHVVRQAVRTGTAAQDTVVVGEIGPDTDWDAALSGIGAVVHLAARVHMMRDPAADPLAEFRRVNVEGTRRLANAAAIAGVRRFVLLSSIKVNGEATSGVPFREADPPAPHDPYGVSKLEAEEVLRAACAGTAMEWVVLRPPLVYGPQVGANFLRLLQLVERGVPLPFAAVDNRRSLIHVRNLAEAIRFCLVEPAAANRVFLVSDGDDVSTPGLIRALAAALGVPARLLPVPAAVLGALGAIPGPGASMRRLVDSLQVDSGALRQLGFAPRLTLDEGLAETVAWYRGGA